MVRIMIDGQWYDTTVSNDSGSVNRLNAPMATDTADDITYPINTADADWEPRLVRTNDNIRPGQPIDSDGNPRWDHEINLNELFPFPLDEFPLPDDEDYVEITFPRGLDTNKIIGKLVKSGATYVHIKNLDNCIMIRADYKKNDPVAAKLLKAAAKKNETLGEPDKRPPVPYGHVSHWWWDEEEWCWVHKDRRYSSLADMKRRIKIQHRLDSYKDVPVKARIGTPDDLPDLYPKRKRSISDRVWGSGLGPMTGWIGGTPDTRPWLQRITDLFGRFYCQYCSGYHSKRTGYVRCKECKRYACKEHHEEATQAGMPDCPHCGDVME